ncbi:hypothetical protein [Paenibacillus paridis]|uniref:hypothetical protein n=1 Tax=Paenibacillus paridis TaxID=2583376 RepID=UPI00111F17F2|nr:hypothetical protein [Paenibacillus paridis]
MKIIKVVVPIIMLGACVSIITLGLYKFYSYKPVNENELVAILGTYKSSSYQFASKSTYELNLKLKEYNTTFNIWSVSLRAINKEVFNELTYGEKINIQILASDLKYLNHSSKQIAVYGVASNENTYLKLKDVNDQEKKNAQLGIIMAIIFTVILIFLIIFICLMLKRLKRIESDKTVLTYRHTQS